MPSTNETQAGVENCVQRLVIIGSLITTIDCAPVALENYGTDYPCTYSGYLQFVDGENRHLVRNIHGQDTDDGGTNIWFIAWDNVKHGY